MGDEAPDSASASGVGVGVGYGAYLERVAVACTRLHSKAPLPSRILPDPTGGRSRVLAPCWQAPEMQTTPAGARAPPTPSLAHAPSPYFAQVQAHRMGGGAQRSALGAGTIPGGGNWAAPTNEADHEFRSHAKFDARQSRDAMPSGADGVALKAVLGRRPTDVTSGGWPAASKQEMLHGSPCRDIIAHDDDDAQRRLQSPAASARRGVQRRSSVTAVEIFGGPPTHSGASTLIHSASGRRGSVTAAELFGTLGAGSPAASPPPEPPSVEARRPSLSSSSGRLMSWSVANNTLDADASSGTQGRAIAAKAMGGGLAVLFEHPSPFAEREALRQQHEDAMHSAVTPARNLNQLNPKQNDGEEEKGSTGNTADAAEVAATSAECGGSGAAIGFLAVQQKSAGGMMIPHRPGAAKVRLHLSSSPDFVLG